MSDSTQIRIVLAEDHVVIRAGLRLLVETREGYKVVGEVSDGVELLDFLASNACDVVVLDLGMPRLNGLDTLAEIRKRNYNVKCIVLTTHKNRSFLKKSIALGAMGYVLKEDAHEMLLNAIDVCFQGKKFISEELMKFMIDELAPEDGGSISPDMLSEREKQIVHLSANGLTSKEIGERLEISFRTVEVHRANIREKLNLANNSELIKFAIEHGLY